VRRARARAREPPHAPGPSLLAAEVHRAKAARTDEGPAAPSELLRPEGDLMRVSLLPPPRARALPGLGLRAAEAGGGEAGGEAAAAAPPPPAPAARGALAQIMAADRAAKEAERAARDAAARRQQASGPWLLEGIVVKCVAKELVGAGYYKAKGVVRSLLDGGFTAELEMAGGGGGRGDLVRCDQAMLETVLPQPGGAVRLLRGLGRGATATLLGVEVERFKARVRVRSRGELEGAELEVDYEDISRVE